LDRWVSERICPIDPSGRWSLAVDGFEIDIEAPESEGPGVRGRVRSRRQAAGALTAQSWDEGVADATMASRNALERNS